MPIKQYLKRAQSLPLHVVALKLYEITLSRVQAAFFQVKDVAISTYSAPEAGDSFSAVFAMAPRPETAGKIFPELQPLLAKIMAHEFDLLGSGWTHLPVGKTEVNQANQKYSDQVQRLISANYQKIDWHLDFKSGYRWNPKQWWFRIPYGHRSGVDIKVPWELARAQHLPWLALGYGVAKGEQNLKLAKAYAQEFQDQILDFIATNPPRFGVNWRCAMDVAIRAANWILALDWFRHYGWQPTKEFQEILAASLRDHGRFIFDHLEFGKDGFRGNHYLANVSGLAYIAACLPSSSEANRWLTFSHRALQTEIEFQFFADGSNFEGSTAYHRLSAEMMLYSVLLFQSLPAERKKLLPSPLWSSDFNQRLKNMSSFSQAITRPDGNICQIGDNDNGRFFKIHPDFLMNSLDENHLSHQSLIEGIQALYSPADRGFQKLDGLWISDLVQNSTAIDLKAADQKTASHFENRELIENSFSSSVARYLFEKMDLSGSASIILNETQQKQSFEVVEASSLKTSIWKDFGLAIWQNESFFMSFRCGPVGQKGRGGHDHNDQLSVEIFSGGQVVMEDPGTGVYTPFPEIRNRYRSVQAHHGPHVISDNGVAVEPGALDQGLFSMNSGQASVLLWASEKGAIGFNSKLKTIRVIKIMSKQVEISDICLEPKWRFALPPQSWPKTSRGYGCV